MDRRTFLRRSALGLAGLALGCTDAPGGPRRASRAGGATDALVVGAGIAGLVAAHRLARAGVRVTVLEAADRVGGRMVTDVVDGCVIDGGANFLSSTYGILLPLIEDVGLGPRLVDASEWSATVRGGTPRRIRRADPNTLLTSGLLDPVDYGVLGGRFWSDLPAQGALGVNDYSAWAGYDDVEARSWSDTYYTPQVTQYIVEPMIQAFYFQPLEGLSRALPAAVLAHGYHQPVTKALRDGLGSLPQRLAAGLDVRLSCPVNAIEVAADGVTCRTGAGTFRAERLVLATPASVARRLHRQADPLEQALMQTGYASTVVVAVATTRQWNDVPELQGVLGLAIPGVERGIVAAVGIESNKNAAATAGGELLNVYLSGAAGRELLRASDEELRARVLAELAPHFPGVEAAVRFTRVYRWAEAEPLSPVGRSRDVLAYRQHGTARRVWLAGDYMSMPWTEGAADAAAWAAGQIVSVG